MTFYAHTQGPDKKDWEPLFTPFGETTDDPAEFCSGQNANQCPHCELLDPKHGHLNKVAHLAARFAAEMFPEGPDREAAKQWGYLVGLWHDLGKYSERFQERLRGAKISIDHSSAGALHAHQHAPPLGSLISFIIAEHHAGLADGNDLFNDRLKKRLEPWRSSSESESIPLSLALPPPPLTRLGAGNDAMALMLRFFFSCLVDADFLATEAFMKPDQASGRAKWPNDVIPKLRKNLETHLSNKFSDSTDTPVNQSRETVRQACADAATQSPGFFSLTVPTGGGKTLSSLLFALRHAENNNLRGIIYVIPYTSIIRQNADVFREAFAQLSKELGREIILEHHSKFEPKVSSEDNEADQHRLASENWNAPIVVTTNVQFFESLFANRTSSCRKLHRIARSVVIFDEVQSLPPRLLQPILRSLTCLVKDFGSTAVFCTATQPALDQRDDFTIGIPTSDIHPIITNETELFDSLKRVISDDLGSLRDDQLISHILDHSSEGCLLILNTTKAAQALHKKLSEHVTTLHLSARMCPSHIMSVLDQAKKLRKKGTPVTLVSTQLIEAGVDISFPVVYRAECGLDSFAQAAGRCNRNGELGTNQFGKVYLFQPTDHPIPKGLSDIAAAAKITQSHILPNHDASDLLSLSAIRTFFEQAIWQAGPATHQWDKPGIVSGGMPCFAQKGGSLTSYKFKTAAQKFRLIDSATHPVFIPWGEKGKALGEKLRGLVLQNRTPNRNHYRQAQQFTVQIYEHEWQSLQPNLDILFEGALAILTHPENTYDPDIGLKRHGTPDDPNAFML